MFDVGYVADTGSQVLVLDVAEHLLEPFHRLRKRMLGGHQIRANILDRLALDLVVLQHRQLGLEYLRQLSTVLQLHDPASTAYLLPYQNKTVEKTLRLRFHLEARYTAS